MHFRTQLQHKFPAYKLVFLVLIIITESANAINTSSSQGFNTKKVDNLTPQPSDSSSNTTQFSGYTLIQPEIYDVDNKKFLKNTLDLVSGLHAPNITLTYFYKGRPINIDLKLNDELLPDEHFMRFQDSRIKSKYFVRKFSKTESELCHYQGSIRDKPSSRVALSTCNGDINGIIFDSSDAYIIHAERNGTLRTRHFLLRTTELLPKSARCGHKNDELKMGVDSIIRHKRDISLGHGPFKANKRSVYVELVIVVDNGLYRFFEEHMGKVHQYCKEVTNIISALYAPLNIFVILTGVVVWNEKDEIEFDNESRVTLDRFLEYRSVKISPEHPNDHAQLLTKNNFNDNVVGKAFVGPMCTEEKSGAVCSVHSPITAVVANTMAHEMGHVFGMAHDNAKKCKCPDKKCIMSDTSSAFIPIHWSSCSIDSLKQAFSQGLRYCLENKPKKLFGSSQCGNGFVEPGEECDCGPPSFCTSNCCDPNTCRLRQNATCGSGECCDLKSCHLKTAGTACREADNECDLSEFCTGKSEFCPKDVYKHDTIECENGAGYCYQGKCGSHQEQCRVLWGSAAVNSEHCYAVVNKRGDNAGNCGLNQQTKEFIKCEEENVMCGKLQCQHPKNWEKFGFAAIAQTWTSYAFHNRKYVDCRSTLFDFGLHTPSPGMTPNGAKCGQQKMCLEQRCIPIPELRLQGIGKTCADNCAGNGVCNSEGNCHCDIGFAGTTCRAPGPGGSIDSGPATNPDAHDAFKRFLYIFFFGVIPFAISFYALFYFYRNHQYFRRKKVMKNDNTLITEVIYAPPVINSSTDTTENKIQAVPCQQKTAKSFDELNSVETETPGTSSNSIDETSLPKVHKSIENLAQTFGNAFISKSASNYELSTLSDSNTKPSSASRKVSTPLIAKKAFKSVNVLSGNAVHSANNTLKPKLEITDVRLQSSTNPLAVALSNGVTLIGNNSSKIDLNVSDGCGGNISDGNSFENVRKMS